MLRYASLAGFASLACFALIPQARAQNPIPATAGVEEHAYAIEVELARDGATLRVTRSLVNPTLSSATVTLPITLPCSAQLDGFSVEELGPDGQLRWTAAELLDPDDAQSRYDGYFDSSFDDALVHVHDADTAMLMTRSYGCDAQLDIFPIPPMQRRSFAYQVFIPSEYVEGRYTIELPSFADYGLIPNLELLASADPELQVSVDQRELERSGVTLFGGVSHSVVLTPRDPGRGRVLAADLDLAAFGADAGSLAHLRSAEFEAPIELARLPPVRRAVVLLDASRSLSAWERGRLQRIGAAYFEALAEQDAHVEVLLFDREVHRLYHDFVPAAWGAEDLAKLEVADQNGSEVGLALASARELLAEPTTATGADWILVLSDLELRTGYAIERDRLAAGASPVRVHVVRDSEHASFSPASHADPWVAVARAAGGMAWFAGGDAREFAAELVAPTRIWELALELELADGSHHSERLAAAHEAGAAVAWSSSELGGAALERAGFVGEVWGQRRAWTATPSADVGRRLAGEIASGDAWDLPEAVLTALAFHAQVITPYTAAFALAQFHGTAPAPALAHGVGFGSSGGFGCSSRCGGSSSCGGLRGVYLDDYTPLAQAILDRCGVRGDGSFGFETTGVEIVGVDSLHRCIAEQTWALDIRAMNSAGRERVELRYSQGVVTDVIVR